MMPCATIKWNRSIVLTCDIVLPSIDKQKKCPRAVKHMREGKFCWDSQKTVSEEDFAAKKHCRILIETDLTYLFNVVSLKIAVFAN